MLWLVLTTLSPTSPTPLSPTTYRYTVSCLLGDTATSWGYWHLEVPSFFQKYPWQIGQAFKAELFLKKKKKKKKLTKILGRNTIRLVHLSLFHPLKSSSPHQGQSSPGSPHISSSFPKRPREASVCLCTFKFVSHHTFLNSNLYTLLWKCCTICLNATVEATKKSWHQKPVMYQALC